MLKNIAYSNIYHSGIIHLMAGLKINLTVVEGPEKGKSFSFDEFENFLLGRNAEGSKVSFPLVGNPSEGKFRRNQNDKSGFSDNGSVVIVQ